MRANELISYSVPKKKAETERLVAEIPKTTKRRLVAHAKNPVRHTTSNKIVDRALCAYLDERELLD